MAERVYAGLTQKHHHFVSTSTVTPDREPLGILDAWMWAREPLDEQGRRGGIKESTWWIESYKRVAEQAATLPTTRLIYVADREAYGRADGAGRHACSLC